MVYLQIKGENNGRLQRRSNSGEIKLKNYSNWKFKIEILYIKERLSEAITETPSTPITVDWSKKYRKARAIVNLSIEERQIIHVKNLQNTRYTWNVLKTIHERTNLSSKLYPLRKLYSTTLAEGGNMVNHVTKILEIIDKLSAIGEEIKHSHTSVNAILLPPSYHTLITTLEAMPEEELTPAFIKSKLTDEFNRRNEHSEPTESKIKAFKTNKRFNNTG